MHNIKTHSTPSTNFKTHKKTEKHTTIQFQSIFFNSHNPYFRDDYEAEDLAFFGTATVNS